MKQIFFIFSFLLLGCLLFTSCKSKQNPVETETIIHKTETIKDTVLVVEKDSSYYQAYIDCVDGKPVLIQSQSQIDNYNNKNNNSAIAPTATPGRSLKSPTVMLENGILTVNCEKEAEEIVFRWKQTFIQEFKKQYIPVTTEKELTTFQKLKMFLGALLFWVLIGLVAVFGIRFLITKKLF